DTAAGERIVPFVQALVPEVDLDSGRIVVADLAGLLTDIVEADDGVGDTSDETAESEATVIP
ncbi:MAG: hypothetical protein LBL92_07585, partial [Propionibacteriaceae bacterium]|nr:hypothetical protein [Propionibacteriaceae bacterium]